MDHRAAGKHVDNGASRRLDFGSGLTHRDAGFPLDFLAQLTHASAEQVAVKLADRTDGPLVQKRRLASFRRGQMKKPT